jgi:hypothetical protein
MDETDWYVRGASMTDPSQFERFLKRLEEAEKEIRRKLRISYLSLTKGWKDPACKGQKITASFISAKRALIRLIEKSNAGIWAYPDGLAILDIDVAAGKTKLPAERVTELIDHFNTFTVKTRNGGFHLYFVNTGIDKLVHLHYENTDIGELRVANGFVVAPGSYVPQDANGTPEATGTYTVIRDVPFKTLNINDIPDWIRIGGGKNSPVLIEKVKKSITELFTITNSVVATADSIENLLGITLKEIRAGHSDFCRELDELLNGAVKGDRNSRSEADFRTAKILWKFWFEPSEIALILQLCRPYEKTLRVDYLARTVSEAIEDAKVRGWRREVPVNNRPPLTLIPRVMMEALPEILADIKYLLIRGTPRIGKTHWGVEQLLEFPHGTYVSHRHTILLHAIGIFKDLNSGRSAVLVIGKNASCPLQGNEKGICDTCNRRLKGDMDVFDGGITRSQYFREVSAILREKRVLTPKEIPTHLCPYIALRLAESRADYCFTVPYFLVNEDHSVEVKPRSITVIDEDPSIDYFYPKTVALAEYYTKHNKESNGKNLIVEFVPDLIALEKQIEAQERKGRYDLAILRLIKLVTDQINPLIETLANVPNDSNKEKLGGELSEIFTALDREADPYNVLRRVKTLTRKMGVRSDNSLADLFEPLLWPAENTFIWSGKNPMTLHLIGERKIIRPPKLDHLMVIGATSAELFIDEICAGAKHEVQNCDILEFPYAKNFVVFRLVGENKRREDTMMNTAIRELAENNRERDDPVPALILTSSKRNQLRVWDWIRSAAGMSRNETVAQRIAHWIAGKIVIFYTNSDISRGVDLPEFDVLLVHSCNFAQPYWESVVQSAIENNDSALELRARVIRSRLIGDELTNSMLRHSPVWGQREDQVKVIVIKSRDWELVEEKVTAGMTVVDIGNDIDLKNMVAALPDLATRTSLPTVLELVGFDRMYPKTRKCTYNNLHCTPEDGTAIIKGKNYHDVMADLKFGFAAVTKKEDIPEKEYAELRDRILEYPTFGRGCKASRHAIVKYFCSRDTKITEYAVKSALKRMAIKSILVQSTDKRGRIIYSTRIGKHGERGTIPFPAAGSRGSQCTPPPHMQP